MESSKKQNKQKYIPVKTMHYNEIRQGTEPKSGINLMLEQSDRAFEIAIIIMLKDLVER